MKKTLLSVAIIATNLVFGQFGTYTFDFNNSNQFPNNFFQKDGKPDPRDTPENFFTYSSINGIDGGALKPPTEIKYNNSILANYFWTIKKVLNEPIEFEVSFKYDNSLMHISDSRQPVVAFFLKNSNDIYSEKLPLLTGGSSYGDRPLGFLGISSDSGGIITNNLWWKEPIAEKLLKDGHWYTAKVNLNPTSDNIGEIIYIKEELFDVGLSGNENPVSLGDLNYSVYRNISNIQEFNLEFFAQTKGGASFVDNLKITANKGAYLNVIDNASKQKIKAFPIPTNKTLNIINPQNGANKIEIYDMSGKLILNKIFNSSDNKISIDVENIPKGNYIYKIGDLSSKFIKNSK